MESAKLKRSLIFLTLIILTINIIYLVPSSTPYQDCAVYGNCKSTTTQSSTVNYSAVNVNNSLYWQGHTGTDGSWLTGILYNYNQSRFEYNQSSVFSYNQSTAFGYNQTGLGFNNTNLAYLNNTQTFTQNQLITGNLSVNGNESISGTLSMGALNSGTEVRLRSGFANNAPGGVGITPYDHSGANADGLALYGSDGMSFYTTQAEAMRILASGNVGVGLTNPLVKFVVQGTSSGTDAQIISIRNSNKEVFKITDYPTFELIDYASATTFGFTPGDGVPRMYYTTANDFYIGKSGDTLGANFWRISRVTATRQDMFVLGYVGIQTTAPTTNLDVNGSTIIRGNLTVNDTILLRNNLNVTNNIVSRGNISVIARNSNVFARVGGVIFDSATDAPNSGTAETQLYANTIPASTLTVNNDKLRVKYAGNFTGSGTATTELKLYFNNTNIYDSTAVALSFTGGWEINTLIIRNNLTSAKYSVTLQTPGASTLTYATTGILNALNFSNANVLNLTGQSAGVGGGGSLINGIFQTGEWLPAA